MNEKIYDYEAYGEKHRIVLSKGNYNSNGSLAVFMMLILPDGHEEPWASLTVNINDSDVFANDSDTAFIDTNNLGEDIISWLIANDIANPCYLIGYSGYCSYPLYQFSKAAIDGMRRIG